MPRAQGHTIHFGEHEGKPLILWAPGQGGQHALCQSLKDGAKDEEDDEYRRLLYVALTRAEDELYIGGYTQGDAPDKSWYGLVQAGLKPVAQTVDMMLPGMGAPQEGLRLEYPSKIIVQEAVSLLSASDAISAPPAFLTQPPPQEPEKPLPLTPSRPPEIAAEESSILQSGAARERGIIIHRLLQYLPEVPPDARERAAVAYLRKHYSHMPQEQQSNLCREILAVTENPHYAAIFSPDSLAEVPISGILEQPDGTLNILSAQVDRVAVTADTVWVVDYKTRLSIPENAACIPPAYLQQMRAYAHAVSHIYPGKTVRAALLWTAGPVFMPIPAEMLEPAFGPA